jgi:acyl carrier protein
MNEFTAAIRQFILEHALQGESPANLRDDTPLQSSGILDSLATLELVTFVEQRFGVELDVYDTSIERFDTVGSIAQTVLHKRSSQQ